MVFLKSPSLRLDESVHTKFFSTVFFHKIYSSHLKKKKNKNLHHPCYCCVLMSMNNFSQKYETIKQIKTLLMF